MSDAVIQLDGIGKCYRVYARPADKVLAALGIDRMLFWRKTQYRDHWALRGVNLKIRRGERVGLIGSNGAGKSTLLKIVCGNVRPSEGSVQAYGEIQSLMELGTAFHPDFTGRQNIRASLAYRGVSEREIRRLEEEIIDFSELDEFIDQPVKTYSAGMYSRLAFSTSTSLQPDILIIDEVLGAGDAYFNGKCIERMRKMTEGDGVTVLFVSHDAAAVQAVCHRAIWINQGCVTDDGPALSILKKYAAATRARTNVRLKARELQISVQQAKSLTAAENDNQKSLMFRLIPTVDLQPNDARNVRRVALHRGDTEMAAINVGAPMDNDPTAEQYLITENGAVNWGESQQDANGFHRPVGEFGGRFGHSPFCFQNVSADPEVASEMSITIEADTGTFPLAVELFDEQQAGYQRLGELPAGDTELRSALPSATESRSSGGGEGESPATISLADARMDAADHYGSLSARITKVQMLDAHNEETRVPQSLSPLKVVLEYESRVNLRGAVFVFCVYLPSGGCATQWFAPIDDMDLDPSANSGEMTFEVESLQLGKGQYVASAAIFKSAPQFRIEPTAHHVMDRCIKFEVTPPDLLDPKDYGICLQSFTVSSYAA